MIGMHPDVRMHLDVGMYLIDMHVDVGMHVNVGMHVDVGRHVDVGTHFVPICADICGVTTRESRPFKLKLRLHALILYSTLHNV